MRIFACLWLFPFGSGGDVDLRGLVLLDMTIGCVDRRGLDLFSLLRRLTPWRLFAVVVPGIDDSRQVHRRNVHTGLLLSYRRQMPLALEARCMISGCLSTGPAVPAVIGLSSAALAA